MKKILSLVILSSIMLFVVTNPIQVQAEIKLVNSTTSIVTNQNCSFTFVGLNESQEYILVFTEHSPQLDNVTFTSSGFTYMLRNIFISNDNDSTFTLNLYQYSSVTNQNSSNLLYSINISEVNPKDLNNPNTIIDNIVILLPILLIGMLIGTIIKYSKYFK